MFTGGGMQTAIFLGMYEAAIRAGAKPDVILATCGGAIAAAVASQFDTPEEMKVYLKSDEFYQALLGIHFTDEARFGGTLKMLGNIKNSRTGQDRGFESIYVLDVPQRFAAPTLDRSFSSKFPVVMIASKIEGDGFFRETYFTDPDTESLLEGLQSPTSRPFRESKVEPQTDVRTDIDMLTALRASISDPFLMAPKEIGTDHYLGGVADLYSIETAQALAEHVIMSYSPEPSHSVFAPAIKDVFGFDVFERLREVQQNDADYWVDFSDYDGMIAKHGFDPTLDLLGFFGKLFGGLFTHPRSIDFTVMKSNIPDDKETYEKMVDYLWNYGKSRMAEALALPTHDFTHIRKMEKYNTSPKRLKDWRLERHKQHRFDTPRRM